MPLKSRKVQTKYSRKTRGGRQLKQEQKKQSHGTKWAVLLALVILLIVVGWLFSRYYSGGYMIQEKRPGKAAPAHIYTKQNLQNEAPIHVKIKRFTAKLHSPLIRLSGTVDAYTRTVLISQVNSIVHNVYGDVGTFFKQGDDLFVFDVNEKRYQFEQASAALSRARLNYNAAQTLYAQGLYSQNQRLEARETLHKAETSFTMAKLDLLHVRVRAPYDGVLESRRIDIGTPVALGTVLGSFIQISPLQVTINVANKDIGYIHIKKPAILQFLTGIIRKGSVISIASSADPITHTFAVQVLFTNRDRKVRVGEMAIVEMASDVKMAHLIPSSVLLLNKEGRIGVMIMSRGKAKFMPVIIQEETKNGSWVLGLPKVTNVVVQGGSSLQNGIRITNKTYKPENKNAFSIKKLKNLAVKALKNNRTLVKKVTKKIKQNA